VSAGECVHRPDRSVSQQRSRKLTRARLQITNGYLKGGASRVYIASRDEKALKQSADEFNKQGYEGKCIPLVANLATFEGVTKLAEELEKREKRASSLSPPRRPAALPALAVERLMEKG